MQDGALVSPGWLAAHLQDPGVRVVEVDVNSVAYDDWHIDGAVLWNVFEDLKDSDYRLIDAAALERLLARSGIRPETTVVFYGRAPALGVWFLTMYRHRDARILDCARPTWRAEGHPWKGTPTHVVTADYRLGSPDDRIRADRAAVSQAIGGSRTILMDVRSAPEYNGERFWPSGDLEPLGRAGHIPSAILQSLDDLYDERGAFRPAGMLRGVFSSTELDAGTDVITYCTIGGRAATAWFVLTRLLGQDRVRVYDGSWVEWGRLAGAPVASSIGSPATAKALDG